MKLHLLAEEEPHYVDGRRAYVLYPQYFLDAMNPLYDASLPPEPESEETNHSDPFADVSDSYESDYDPPWHERYFMPKINKIVDASIDDLNIIMTVDHKEWLADILYKLLFDWHKEGGVI